MTIRYALTRTEIVRSYFRSLSSSPKYLLRVLLLSLGVGVFTLVSRGARTLTGGDIGYALAWAIGLFLFMPFWLFVRGKTSERTLSVSEAGILTQIGKLNGEIPWKSVSLVDDGGDFILICRIGGNAFFIPNRAFARGEQREAFLQEIRRLRTARAVSA